MCLARPIKWIESKESGEMNASKKEMKRKNYTMSIGKTLYKKGEDGTLDKPLHFWEMTQTRLN